MMRKTISGGHTAWLLMGLSMSMALIGCKQQAADEPAAVSVEETRAIAREAYLWGFPMVETYKLLYQQAVGPAGSDFRAPLNQIANSSLWMDLRTEPLVLTIPKIDKERYFSVQLVDLYTHNFDYLGSRTADNDGGIYLIAGPDWRGEPPSGIKQVIRPETQIAYAIFRHIQTRYQVLPLSTFLGASAPPTARAINFPPYDTDRAHGVGFFSYLNFLMQFAPLHPSEVDLRRRFSTIGILPGRPFDTDKIAPETLQALLDGIADAEREFAEFKKTRIDTQEVRIDELFGTRESLHNNYLYRYAGARIGIFGNSAAEVN